LWLVTLLVVISHSGILVDHDTPSIFLKDFELLRLSGSFLASGFNLSSL
jgi:hypothetical protein